MKTEIFFGVLVTLATRERLDIVVRRRGSNYVVQLSEVIDRKAYASSYEVINLEIDSALDPRAFACSVFETLMRGRSQHTPPPPADPSKPGA